MSAIAINVETWTQPNSPPYHIHLSHNDSFFFDPKVQRFIFTETDYNLDIFFLEHFQNFEQKPNQHS